MSEFEKSEQTELTPTQDFEQTTAVAVELTPKEKKAQQKEKNREEFREWFFFRKREFIKNFNIVKQLVIKSVKVQYRNSVIGIFWTILNPLLNMLVMYLVFSNMFGRGGGTYVDGNTYTLYLLCGNIVFGMMRTATYQALPSLVHNRGLLTKNKMSYNVFPLANTLSAMVNFAFSFIALLGVMLVVSFQGNAVFSWNILLALVVLPALFLFCYGLSLVLSAMYTFFRDIMHFYNVFLTLWMYLTPIFYSASIFEDKEGFLNKFMSFVVKVNPMTHFVDYFRAVLYRCSAHAGAIEYGAVTRLEAELAVAINPDDIFRITNDIEAIQSAAILPGFSTVALLYGIGIISTLIGAIVFMCTKRKFIYNI